MNDQTRLLAFVGSEEYDQVSVHLYDAGIEILMASLERLPKSLSENKVEHEHLSSDEWGGWELSISDQVEKGRGKPVHHIKLYGWNDEWAEKNGFDRTSK